MSNITLADKGKAKALPEVEPVDETHNSGVSASDSDSDSDSSSDSESDSADSDASSENEFDDTAPEYIESLLEKARQNIASQRTAPNPTSGEEEEVIKLDSHPSERYASATHSSCTGTTTDHSAPLPPLDPGKLPEPYIDLSKDPRKGSNVVVHDPDVEQAEKATSSRAVPAEPIRPPELSKDGKPLSKKEQKELRKKEKGLGYFDLPTHSDADLPRLYREVEALRLRNQLDPKRFYRKEEGEGKGIKGLPKQFAIGTILPTNTPFGTQTQDNLPKSARKRTIVDELVDDAEAKSYAKKKFKELQTVRGARGRNTLHQKKAMRKAKW
ncbi:Fcf2-domain-containing protein [Gloeophyllum trabeum ATCC 11539]|uniref:Fcf2-domain-containing protein n=1 Tax=Gloeophyllum trabeum (strain ATCC 11539 / FP-39264 / Madison 617) TaxID=670483 RepID=S7R9T9_GLOTA|nr:Fcf2-domain-containing protein [Gloeophyllum trabeum ATCC 11539]EPQ51000.1 Fcf2-domain-containing protein [Gloeophyllum trabeum ATCC 11539]